jgi:hypothetical protein
MNLNAFNQSIRRSYEAADALDLFPRPISLFSITNIIDVRELENCASYVELYNKLVNARNLNFFFLSGDFFQFSFRGGSFRYAQPGCVAALEPKRVSEYSSLVSATRVRWLRQ